MSKKITLTGFQTFLKAKFSAFKKIVSKTTNHLSLLSLVTLMFVLLAITGIILLITRPGTKQVAAAWWNDGWMYRKIVPISNTGSEQTDFQVGVTLDTASLISAGKMQGDCDDLRVTDAQGKTLPYWIEENNPGCNDAATKIWVKVNTIPTSGTAIYFYYGNPSTESVESGEQVFEFFDNFSTYSTGALATGGKWVWESSVVSPTIVDDSGTEALRLTPQDNGEGPILATLNVGNTVLHTRVRDDNNNHYHIGRHSSLSSPVGDTGNGFWIYPSDIHCYQNNAGYKTWNSLSETPRSLALSTYRTYKMVVSDDTWELYEEGAGSPTATGTDSTYSSGYPTLMTYSGEDLYVDYFFARKYASTEPSIGSLGNEEQALGPVAYWKFDEGYGNTANDSTQNNNDGSLGTSPANPSWQGEGMCVSGKCLYFDGTDYVDIVDNDLLNFGTSQDFSISVWVKASGGASDEVTILSKGDGGGNPRLLFKVEDDINDTILFRLSEDATTDCVGTEDILDNNWHFLTFSVDRDGQLIGYVDGAVACTGGTSNSQNITTDVNLRIGQSWSGDSARRYWNGFIDELKIYPYARSADQVRSDYLSRGSVHGLSTQIGEGNPENSLSQGLVGYWKMDENVSGDAKTITDFSGNGNDGTTENGGNGMGMDCTVTGQYGPGCDFDGTDDYIGMSDFTSSFDTEATFSVWIKAATTASSGAWHLGTNGSNDHYIYGGKLYAGVFRNSREDFGAPPVTVTEWNHLVITTSPGANNYKVYFNGTEFANTTGQDTIYFPSDPRLGRSESWHFEGEMDEARIYNRALSPQEVRDLYNYAPKPQVHLKFDEGSGSSAYDSSGNQYDGTLNNNPQWVKGKYGGALKFNALSVGSASTVTGSLGLSSGEAFTVSYWIHRNGSTATIERPFIFDSSNYQGMNDSGNINFHLGGGASCTSNTVSAGTNTWTHISFVYDGSSIQGFTNGVANTAVACGTTSSFSGYQVGGQNLYYAIDGSIDDVRIYNYARTRKQIIEDMNAGHPMGGSPIGSQYGYWKFDEGYGDTANDSSPQENDGNLTGSCPGDTTCPSWTDNGKFGKALDFNASDKDTITFPAALGSNTAFGGSEGTVTLSFWIKPDDAVTRYFLSYIGGLQYMRLNADRTLFARTCGLYPTSNGTVATNEWTHVVAEFSGQGYKFYINGELDTNVSDSDYCISSSGTATLGTFRDIDTHFDGKIDEFKVYNDALTEEEVKLEYNQGKTLVMGATSTGVGGTGASFSSSREYCIPGDTTSCNSPIAEWTFNEGVGSTAYSTGTAASTNGGMLGTGEHWAVGKIGKAANFNGTDNYVSVAPSSAQSSSTFTIEMWFNFGDTSVDQVLYSSPSGQVCNLIYRNSGSYIYSQCDSWSAHAAVPFVAGSWYHLAYVHDGSYRSIYINGNLEAQDEFSSTINYFANETRFGRAAYGGSSYFNGKIDQAKIYDYARTPAQIAWDHNRGKPIAQWKFDECQGTTAYDSIRVGATIPNGTITIGESGSQSVLGTCSIGTGSTAAWGNGSVGKINSSLNFDGSDDYVDLGTSPILYPDQMTISAWTNFSSISGSRVIASSDDSSNRNWALYYNEGTGNVRFFVFIDGASKILDYSFTPSLDTWYHIAGTADGTNIRLYINGLQVGDPVSALGDIDNDPVSVKVGVGAYPGYFSGQIDDVQLFNYALTGTQVKTLYNNGAVSFSGLGE